MNGWAEKNYPAKVLLANDNRFSQFVDSSVCQEWDTAVQKWRALRRAAATTSQQQARVFCSAAGGGGGIAATAATARNADFFSDEEFFLLTQQLEDMAATLTGSSVGHPAAHQAGSDTPHSSKVFLDLLALDPAMFSFSLEEEQRARCQQASLAYEEGKYCQAAEIFSSVIDSCLPNMLNAALVCNRAACYMLLENYKFCFRDAMRAYEMDNQYVLGIRRAVRSQLCLGKCSEARGTIETYMKNKRACEYVFESELEEISLFEKYSALLNRHEHAAALRHLNELLKRVPCATFESLKVQLITIEEGNCEALMYVNDCLERYPNFPELLYWHAQLRFLECATKGELEEVLLLCDLRSASTDYGARFRQVFQRVKQCISLYQDLDLLFLTKDWVRLVERCTTATQFPFLGDRLRAVVLTKRAYGLYEVRHFYECMNDIVVALRFAAAGCERAQLLLLKALCEEKLLRWSDAVCDAELAMKEDRTAKTVDAWRHMCERQKEFQRRKQEQQQQQERQQGKGHVPRKASDSTKFYEYETSGNNGSKRAGCGREKTSGNTEKDSRHVDLAQLYAQLSLPCGASAERVRKSYRALALQWHPDKWCTASDSLRKTAEEKFKVVNDAYDKLMCIVVD